MEHPFVPVEPDGPRDEGQDRHRVSSPRAGCGSRGVTWAGPSQPVIRDDLRDYVTEHLGDAGAVLVVDETGDLNKGTGTVGVQRQYTGIAGRIENSQVAVLLAYATDAGHAFIDRELYLPASWGGDADRRAKAGVPADRTFATMPELAR